MWRVPKAPSGTLYQTLASVTAHFDQVSSLVPGKLYSEIEYSLFDYLQKLG